MKGRGNAMKRNGEARQEREREALANAVNGLSGSNYPAIVRGFLDKGIPETEIKPRENIFTYAAWRALKRQVRRGEHGVKVVTFVPMEAKELQDDGTEKKVTSRRPWHTTVFHLSQTDTI